MPRKPPKDLSLIPTFEWYDKAADQIVRNGKTLFQYCNETDRGITKLECDAIAQTPDFQLSLRLAKNRFFKQLATDPSRSKNVALGQAVFAIEKMLDAQQWDKAVAALMMLFKMEGWSQEGSNVTILQQINQKEFDTLRQKIKGELLDKVVTSD